MKEKDEMFGFFYNVKIFLFEHNGVPCDLKCYGLFLLYIAKQETKVSVSNCEMNTVNNRSSK